MTRGVEVDREQLEAGAEAAGRVPELTPQQWRDLAEAEQRFESG